MPGSGYFYDETNRNKLIVLYFIKSLNIELTRSQIADFSVAHDLIPTLTFRPPLASWRKAASSPAFRRHSGRPSCLPRRAVI